MTRRTFVESCVAIGVLPALGATAQPVGTPEAGRRPVRRYHLSVSPDALDADPELLPLVHAAGVTDVWVTGFLYGYWYYPLEKSMTWRRRIEAAGMAAHLIDVPLGHPGDSLGAMSGAVPLTPPKHWRPGVRPDGSTYAGTSLHPPATDENRAAVRRIEQAGFREVFLDDDFRLAQGPGVIGGCFCPDHRAEFLRTRGYADTRWTELLDAVAHRSLTPVLREWVRFTCDQLTACFQAQRKAAPHIDLGIMVMYMGAEKAGIRLADYRDAPFRVGEGMFDDGSFGPAKNKTVELFSALLHRRCARPERAYSETTAYPAARLSAANMAAKLAVSTLADVRNTMFMSGVTALPRTHWETLTPAMRKNAAIHARLAGHRPRGPFKHFWGEHGRSVSDDNPYSLFLAAGVPFEVCDRPARDGWTFLGDADAQAAAAGALRTAGTMFVTRPSAGAALPSARTVEESLPGLFALKRDIAAGLGAVPYVEEDWPAVCAWYPDARSALVWNLSEERRDLTVRCGAARRTVTLGPLDLELVPDVDPR